MTDKQTITTTLRRRCDPVPGIWSDETVKNVGLQFQHRRYVHSSRLFKTRQKIVSTN